MSQPYDAIRLHEEDNVATLVRAVEAGLTIRIAGPAGEERLLVGEAIPLCHKVSVLPIASGERVRKYGQAIGSASQPIQAGRHVHVHNMRSDKAKHLPSPA